MRIKRTLAALLGCLTLAASCVSPVYAYTGEETTDTTAVTATAETAATTSDTASANQSLPYSVTTDKDGSVVLSVGDQKWTFDLSEETRRIGTVQVNSYLHLRTGAGMSYDIIGYLKPGQQVEVIGDAGDWYKVTIPEQTGYVHGDYLRVSEQTVDNKLDEDSLALLLALLAQNQSTAGTTGGTSSGSAGTNTGVSLTPPGNLTLVDDIGSTTAAGQQFITLVSKNGNTFYMVIDRNDKGEENVHFMNLVDEADLFALLDEDAQSSYLQNQTPAPTEPVPTETEPEPTEPTEPEKPAKKSGWAGIMLLLIIAIGGGGFYVYNFIIKKKQEQEADKPDPDADYEDEDDEEYDLPEEEGYEEETEEDFIEGEDNELM